MLTGLCQNIKKKSVLLALRGCEFAEKKELQLTTPISRTSKLQKYLQIKELPNKIPGILRNWKGSHN